MSMAIFTSAFLYVLLPGVLSNEYIVDAPVPNGAGSTDAGDNQLDPNEVVPVTFDDPIVEATLGGDFTYLGYDAALDGYVAQSNDTTTLYLFANVEASDGQSITALDEPFAVCFLEGTMIATPEGERTVESLAIGDVLLKADGSFVKVKWIGRQRLNRFFASDRLLPVRIAAGALGDGTPNRDLLVTADHGMVLDGLVVNASALVNGVTITYEPKSRLPSTITYYHIETEEHDVILANGAASETYIDYVGRSVFDNYAEYLELYGNDRSLAEMERPRVSAARLLPPAIRARLAVKRTA